MASRPPSAHGSSSAGSEPENLNFFLRAIKNHYSNNEYHRTAEQIERERSFFGLPFNRWALFPAAVFAQFCCGSLYAWSVFTKPIDQYITGDANAEEAPNVFYLAVGCFGFSAALTGPWLERNGPRMGLFVGATLFFIGNLLSALAVYTKQMWLVYIGYGAVAGFGLGLSYISPVSALQKWFPDHRGLASGFAVCGFGAGSIAIAKVILPLKAAVGLPDTFVVLGACYYAVMLFSAYTLRIPPPDFSVKGIDSDGQLVAAANSSDMKEAEEEKSQYQTISVDDKSKVPPTFIKTTLIQSLASYEYSVLYVVFFANSIFGLVAISRLSPMIADLYGKSSDYAATMVSINGGVNLLGRLVFATLSDVVGRKLCYVIMLLIQTVGLILLPIFTSNGNFTPFIACMFLMTACYGGGFGVIPAFLTDLFGSKNIGACHGVILTAWSIAGVAGGLIFTSVYNSLLIKNHGTHTVKDPYIYNVNFYWILAICIVGCFFLMLLRVSVRDRLFPNIPGQIFRLRVFGRLIRVSTSKGVEFISKDEEDRIWREHWAAN